MADDKLFTLKVIGCSVTAGCFLLSSKFWIWYGAEKLSSYLIDMAVEHGTMRKDLKDGYITLSYHK